MKHEWFWATVFIGSALGAVFCGGMLVSLRMVDQGSSTEVLSDYSRMILGVCLIIYLTIWSKAYNWKEEAREQGV